MKQTKFLVFWNPYEEEIEFSKAQYFEHLFCYKQHVVMIDLKNNKDPRSLSLLREADLVVVFMKQSLECFETYFVRDYIPGDKTLFAITDYISDGMNDWPGILGQFRIPRNRLFFLPRHNQLQYVKESGLMYQYHQGKYENLSYEQTVGFYPNYKSLCDKIYSWLA